jgi:hypothetical protein
MKHSGIEGPSRSLPLGSRTYPGFISAKAWAISRRAPLVRFLNVSGKQEIRLNSKSPYEPLGNSTKKIF